MKYLEAVTVCVNYGDILKVTIPYNKPLFDKWVIVTDTRDTETQDICRYHGITCVATDVFYEDNAPFNKAKGINKGLDHLLRADWVLHLDADIILPANFRQICKDDQLQRDAIYGVDRVNIVGQEQLLNFILHNDGQIKQWTYLDPSMDFKSMFRLHNLNAGYNVIGFFQLFHSSYFKERSNWYPVEHTNAARTDVGFQQKWPVHKRLFYPGIIAYHIETEPSPKGANWNGRKSKRLDNKPYVPHYPDWVYKGLPNPDTNYS